MILENMKKKKGISPVVATVLLIMMVVVIGLIIFLWFRGLSQEAVTKFGGTNIELICDEVDFSSDYSGGTLFVSNFGNVPIYSLKLKIIGEGSHSTQDVIDLDVGWLNTGLRQGGVFSGTIDLGAGAEKVIVIPVLMGTSKKGQTTHVCDERYGKEIFL